MNQLRLYLTGEIVVECGNAFVSQARLPGRQGALFLALLALRRGQAVCTDELVDALWNAEPPAAVDVALRSLASKLRGALAALGDRVSISQAFGCYQLQLPADAWIDIEAANDAAHRAERALTDGSVADAAGWALVANAIARRGFLPGSTGSWADAQRMRLAELRLRALAVRGEAHLRQGQASQAAADAVTAIEIDPFREPAHRLLMRARLAEGDRAEALRAYERCRRLLADELGTDPDAETQAEHLRILQG